MELARLVEVWSALRQTRSRKAKTKLLAGLLHDASSGEVALVVGYLSAQLRQGKIGLGYAAVQEALVAESGGSGGSLSLTEIDKRFDAIGRQHGKGSKQQRQRLLRSMAEAISATERRFLASLIVGELRQGASEGVMCDAIAEASSADPATVRRAFMLCGDLPKVAVVALVEGARGLQSFDVTLFVPLRPMLAQPASDVRGAIEELGEALFEYKLDGARIQVHRRGDEVRVYSRALNDVTHSVPEIVEATRTLAARSLILDGEALALQPNGRPHRFQTTMRRFGRRRDVEAARRSLPLSVYFFDLLYLDGESLIDLPLQSRLAKMEALVSDAVRPRRTTTDRVEIAEALWSQAIEEGHEGLMAKGLSSTYEAGSRGAHWLKLKPAHTLDLVVVAAEWGSGRRRGWLSNLHLAAYDPENNDFVMLGKTFKGLTDELLAWQTEELLARETHREDYVVHVRPELVVEIAFNEVQQSPRYPGGLALRFARVKRYRTDKTPKSADVIETVRAIHEGAQPRGS